MQLVLLTLLNLTLFLRPAEIVPALIGLPIYNVVILACLAVTFPEVLGQLSAKPHWRPVTLCVLGLLPAIMLSHLSHLATWEARHGGTEFLKVEIYFLLATGIIQTTSQYRKYLTFLFLLIVFSSALAIAQYHGLIDIPALDELQEREFDEKTGEFRVILRLRSTGLFNDPNDLCSIANVGTMLGMCLLGDRSLGLLRLMVVPALGILGYTVVLTGSRGGLLGLLAGLMTLFWSRYGRRRAILAMIMVVPAAMIVVGGRQTDLSAVSSGTGQDRIELWSEGLQFLRQAPLFGIGQGLYAEEAGLVAHNSFVHCFGELGFFGGTLFLGAFLSSFAILRSMPAASLEAVDEVSNNELRRMRPYLLAAVVAYSSSLFTLSRPYVVPTYTVLALASVYQNLAGVVLDSRSLIKKIVAASLVFPVLIYVIIKVMAR